MTSMELGNIHTNRNSYRDTIPFNAITLKLPLPFYLLMKKPLGCYFQVWFPYSAGSTVQPENTYSCILKVTGQV